MTAHETIQVTVNAVTSGPQLQARGLDALILRLGGPQAVMRACDRIALVTAVAAIAYVAAWTITLGAVVGARWPGITTTGAVMLSLAWTPIMAFQLMLGFVRYRAINLLMSEARHLSELTINGFHQRVAEAIGQAVAEFEERRHEPKPTIQ